ncbi:MAG: prolyl oligopeptidase family serine peptidase [Saprospiraceae bacterium]
MKAFITCLFLLPTWLLFSQLPYDLAPRELFFKEKDKTQVHVSKEGEIVFYKKNEEGSENNVYYLSIDAPNVVRQKEFTGPVLDYLPTYDEGIVALVQQDTNLQVHFTTVNSSKIRTLDLFPFERLRFLQLSARFPNKILVNITAKESASSGIYLLDMLNGNLKRLGRMDDFQQLFFDQNFSKVAALSTNELGGYTISQYQSGEWVPVFEHPFAPDMFIGGLSRIISVSVDGKTIYATTNFEKDKTALVAIDVASGEVTELATDPDADILPYAASIDATGKPTSVVALWGDTKRHFLDETVQKDFEFLNAEIKDNVGYVEATQDDKAWLVRKLGGGPSTYYYFDRATQKLTELFNDYSYLNDYELGTRKAHTVTTRDGKKLPVHVYLPPGMSKADGMPKTPLPTVVYVHGGPWAGVTHWNSWFHTRNFQLLANRGYAVINMEFRGTTGLGKELCDAGNLEWGGQMHNDIVDVVTWATRGGIANPKRVAMWGWSYGGYATNYALGAAPDLFSCGISMYGICDLYEFTKLPFADNDLWRNRVGDPNTEEGAALLKSHSPTTYIKGINSPILLTTGSLDDRVPQKQVDDFAKALNDAKKKVVYFYYPEEGHDYRQAESWISFWAIAEDFLHKHTGGRKQPRGVDIEAGNFTTVFGAEYIEDIE